MQSSTTSLNSLETHGKTESKSDSKLLDFWKDCGFSSRTFTDFTKVHDSLENPRDNIGPCYMGICLPININDMFPSEGTEKNNESINQDIDKSSGWLSEKNYNIQFDMSNFDNETSFKHDKQNCLLCCRSGKVQFKPNVLPKIIDCDESISQSFSMTHIDDKKLTFLILKHIQRTANPVWYKQSKQSLLELKQAHPLAFQDICLYSDMCNSMSNSTYRLNARRFLQELFLDLNFNQFFSECEYILTNLPSLDFILHQDTESNTEESDDQASTSQSHYSMGNKGFSKKDEFNSSQELKQESSQNCIASTSSKIEPIQKTDALRVNVLNLSCTKNKFPITSRIASQSVDQKPSFLNNMRIN